MSSLEKRIEETENLINEWQKKESLWNVCSPTYNDRNMRHKSDDKIPQECCICQEKAYRVAMVLYK